jgi:putative hydrolases of HD superfamily
MGVKPTGQLPDNLGISARLEQQLAFLVEVDKLKTVLRQNSIADGSRKENTAEHSWQLALAATILAEHANEPVRTARVTEMLLVHDLVEIYAGDTFVYADSAAAAEQELREQQAADKLFALLPSDQCAYLRACWDEFEARESAESRFAKSIDRLMPMLLNVASGGGSWQVHAITADKPHNLIDSHMLPGSEALTRYGHALIDHAVDIGFLLPAIDPLV